MFVWISLLLRAVKHCYDCFQNNSTHTVSWPLFHISTVHLHQRDCLEFANCDIVDREIHLLYSLPSGQQHMVNIKTKASSFQIHYLVIFSHEMLAMEKMRFIVKIISLFNSLFLTEGAKHHLLSNCRPGNSYYRFDHWLLVWSSGEASVIGSNMSHLLLIV